MQPDSLLESQARVYEALDVATKPAQWLIGGIKAVLLLLIFAAVGIGAPIYAVMHGGSFSSFEFATGCYILGLLVILFAAPWYTLLVGAAIYCSLCCWDIRGQSSGDLFVTVLWIYEAVGLLVAGAKIVLWLTTRRKDRRLTGVIDNTTCGRDGQFDRYVPDNTNSATQNSLSPDSPVPEHLRRRLAEIAQSIIDEGEAVIQQGHSRVDTDAMPLDHAMKTTNAMLLEMQQQMQELCQRMAGGDFRSKEEAKVTVRRFLELQRNAHRRLLSMLARVKRESAPYPVAEMEEELNHFRETAELIQRTATAKGLL